MSANSGAADVSEGVGVDSWRRFPLAFSDLEGLAVAGLVFEAVAGLMTAAGGASLTGMVQGVTIGLAVLTSRAVGGGISTTGTGGSEGVFLSAAAVDFFFFLVVVEACKNQRIIRSKKEQQIR